MKEAFRKIDNNKGTALIITLLVVALLTSMVVEFAYGVYANTSMLHNWQASQEASLIAKSGISLSEVYLKELLSMSQYSYPGSIDLPVEKPFPDKDGSLDVRLEDESGKININNLVFPNGLVDAKTYGMFQRLLKALNLKPEIADAIVRWIEPVKGQGMEQSFNKHAPLWSLDELKMIKGIDENTFNTLKPYVTLYSDGFININAAEMPVLLSLSDDMTPDLCQRIIEHRELFPFKDRTQLMQVPGFETLGLTLQDRISVKGSAFRVVSTGDVGGIKRVIEAIIDMSSGTYIIKFWREG